MVYIVLYIPIVKPFSVAIFRFGFVDFETAAAAKAAKSAMEGESIDGREVHLDFAAERGSGSCS